MPRKLLVEYTCDRCGRKWYENYEEGKEPPEAPHLSLQLYAAPPADAPARGIAFEALCQSCYQTVINLIDSMDKLEKKSPKPRAKKSPPKGAPTPSKEAIKQLTAVGTSPARNNAALNPAKPR